MWYDNSEREYLQTVSPMTPQEFDLLPQYAQELVLQHRSLPEISREQVEQQLQYYWQSCDLELDTHYIDYLNYYLESKENAGVCERSEFKTGDEPSVHRFENGGESEQRHESDEIHVTPNLTVAGREDGGENCVAQYSDSV